MTTPSAPKGSALAALFGSLRRLGVEYAGSISAGTGGKFFCPNPDHEDDHASFDVHVGRNGKPIFTCTPCRESMGQADFIDVLRSHGVNWKGAECTADEADFGPAAVVTGPSNKKGSAGEVALTAVYTYKHADGTPNFKVKRYDPVEGSEARKHFRPARYEPGQGFITGRGTLDNVERTPYHLEEFSSWAEAGRPLYLVEGEKAADALVASGVHATTFHGGTAGKLEPEWPKRYGFDRFEVRVWPDADEAGVERARSLLDDLKAAGVKSSAWGCTLPTLKAKDDAADVLERGELATIHRLSQADAKALAELHPKPKARVTSSRSKPSVDAVSIEVNGKRIVSAGAQGGLTGVEKPEDDLSGVEVGPYSVAASQEPYAFAREMIERHWVSNRTLTLRFRHDDRTFWLWHPIKSRYDHLSEDDIAALVKQLLDGAEETFMTPDGPEVRRIKVKGALVNEIVNHLASLSLTSEYGAGSLLPSVGGVPFRNGWLDAGTGELLPIGPERDIRWNVPADYDPSAKCPNWLEFLASLGWTKETEEYRLLRQIIGYLLSGRKDHEKGIMLLGPSRSGKGTIIHVCHALLGEGAVGTTLHSLTTNFGLQNFIGKGLATIGDARFGRSDKALNGVLLSLTSNDPLPVDVKYSKPLSVNLPVRLLIATNETPSFIEASDALGMRFLVLKFTQSFIGREDRTLLRRLLKELPGIARWALGGLRDLNDEGRFSETAAGRAVQKQMITDSAFVRLFVEECCELGEDFRVENDRLYAEYATWAAQNGMPVYNSVKFGRDLLDAFPGHIDNTRIKKGGKVARGKSGVRLA